MLAVLLAVVALALAAPALAQDPQTCARPSTCETDARARAEALTALRLRSEALNRRHGLATAVAPTDSFDWGDASLGALTGLGLGLLGAGGALALRRRVAHP